MSSPTWTADALRSRTTGWEGIVWRIIEAQHAVSTRKLVDSRAEQELLENLIEKTKPYLPPECRDIHFLLATPFRYGRAARPTRFRATGESGVFYASERVETAVAEIVFYRRQFFAESPDTPRPDRALEHTAFSVHIETDEAIDLTAPPFDREAFSWMHPTDYAPCQALGRSARKAGIELIRYASVRDRPWGRNVIRRSFRTGNCCSSRIAYRPFANTHHGRASGMSPILPATPGSRRSLRDQDDAADAAALFQKAVRLGGGPQRKAGGDAHPQNTFLPHGKDPRAAFGQFRAIRVIIHQ